MEETTNITATTEPTTPATPPAQQPGTMPPQAATVDVAAITKAASEKAEEAAGKKMEAVFKSMLQQQGLDAETITKMTEDWKSKQATPESKLQELTEANESIQAEKEALEKRLAAAEKGIPAGMHDKYAKLAEAYLGEDKDFAKALDAALADFPLKGDAPTPKFTQPAGTGSTPSEDEFQKRINKYRRE